MSLTSAQKALSDVELLATPVHFTLSGKSSPNRFLKSAMTERLCEWSETDNDRKGRPTPEYLKLYEEWGKGKTGTIILGNIPVDSRYPEAKKNAVIDKTASWDHVAAFKPVIGTLKSQGLICIAQLTHAGRQTSSEVIETPVSSSDVQCPPSIGLTFNKPRPLTQDEIIDLADRFAYAAKVIYDAGGDGVQLHAAHGYLYSQFLSPRVNTRTDKYGGTPENRSRIIFETIDAIRKVVPDEKFILSIKINSADFADGGFSDVESKDLILKLDKVMDLIELSGGTYESRGFEHKKESTIKREAFFIEFAERIRPHLKNAKLAVTGGFRSTGPCAEALRSGACDLIGLARPLTAEPDLPILLMTGKSTTARNNLVDPAIQTGPAVMQIHDIANGIAIRDLSVQAVADATVAVLMAPKAQA